LVGSDREIGVDGERDGCESTGIRDGEAGVVGVKGEDGRRVTDPEGEYGSRMDEAGGESMR
jgi:hypothetical protein